MTHRVGLPLIKPPDELEGIPADTRFRPPGQPEARRIVGNPAAHNRRWTITALPKPGSCMALHTPFYTVVVCIRDVPDSTVASQVEGPRADRCIAEGQERSG